MSGAWAVTAYLKTRASRLLGDPNVALHIAAFPSAFLMPGILLLSMRSGSRSDAHVWADLYISQNAALAATGPVVALVALVEEESAEVLSGDAERVSVHDITAHI